MTNKTKSSHGARTHAQQTKEPSFSMAPPAPPTPPAPAVEAKPKKIAIKQSLPDVQHAEYEIISGGGVSFLLSQKGVTVFDKETEIVRELRYCPNEPSIWRDEQSDRALKKPVIFTEGRLFVPKEKPNLRLFLDMHSSNVANGGNLFKKVDKQAEAKLSMEKDFLVNDAITLVREKELSEILPVAIYFGVDVNASTMDIRHGLLLIAKSNPQGFIDSFDNPTVKVRSTVEQAKSYQIINVKEDGVYWFDSRKLIVSVPVGRDSIEVAVRFCLTDKGASVLSMLEDKLEALA